MPGYSNQFGRPKYYDHEVLDVDGKKVGTVRVKPVAIQWKPANAHRFYKVSLEKFAKWITHSETKASITKS